MMVFKGVEAVADPVSEFGPLGYFGGTQSLGIAPLLINFLHHLIHIRYEVPVEVWYIKLHPIVTL